MEPSLKRPSGLGEFASLNPDFVTAAGWLVEDVVALVDGAVVAVAAATVLATVLAVGAVAGAAAGASGFFSVGTGLSLRSEIPRRIHLHRLQSAPWPAGDEYSQHAWRS